MEAGTYSYVKYLDPINCYGFISGANGSEGG